MVLACTLTDAAVSGVPLMMIGCFVGSIAVLTQLAMWNVAGLLAGMTVPVLASRFSTRASPPTMKHAAPVLRLPAGDLEGLAMFLAKLQTAVPFGVFGGSVNVKLSEKACALLTF